MRECSENLFNFSSKVMDQNQEGNINDEVQQPAVPNLQIQALMGEMKQMMRAELEPMIDWIG